MPVLDLDRREQAESSFCWVAVADLARGHKRAHIAFVIQDELRRGRIESNGNGHVRLREGVLPLDLIRALTAPEPWAD